MKSLNQFTKYLQYHSIIFPPGREVNKKNYSAAAVPASRRAPDRPCDGCGRPREPAIQFKGTTPAQKSKETRSKETRMSEALKKDPPVA
jgi:hypothetical protein